MFTYINRKIHIKWPSMGNIVGVLSCAMHMNWLDIVVENRLDAYANIGKMLLSVVMFDHRIYYDKNFKHIYLILTAQSSKPNTQLDYIQFSQ